jgi:glycerol-3-phosphate acyltransferase PlsY
VVFLKLFTLFLAYGLGSIPFGLLICMGFAGKDPRTEGSENIGATNVARIAGTGLGAATLALDAGKGFLAVCLARVAFDDPVWLGVAALLAVVGHCYSVLLDFNGGKGVATAAGAFLALAPLVLLVDLVVWGAVLWWGRKSSLASLAAAGALPLLCAAWAPEYLHTALLVLVLLVYRHKNNITRLYAGEESEIQEPQGD